MTRVKICGVTSEVDALLCAEAGADAVGFVVEFPLPVPWTLERARAAALMRLLPPFVSRVAVVGGPAAAILGLVEATAPDVVQLHLDESEETVTAVRDRLAGSGTRIVKAIRIDPAAEPPPTAGAVLELGRRFLEAGADAILLDSKTSRRPAGTGAAVDRSLAAEVSAGLGGPLILAGGLTPENVGGAIVAVRPYAVDVISSVEDGEHRKAPDRVRAFVAAARPG